MNRGAIYIIVLALVGAILFVACDNNTSSSFEESVDVFVNLERIDGASNMTAVINRGENVGRDSWFELDLRNIENHSILPNGVVEGWCVEFNKPINSSNATHVGLTAFSTFGQEKWKPLNYFLNIKDQLQENDPELDFRDIQTVIWSLLEAPKFDINEMSNDELPARLRNSNGTPAFDKDKVNEIVTLVKEKSPAFKYKLGKKYAVLMETDKDDQNTMTPFDETIWAYGQTSFRCNLDGGQWGWVYKYEGTEGSSSTTPLIAGGGDETCTDTDSPETVGTKVGDLEVSFSGNTLDINYSVTLDDLVLSEAHLWVGCKLEDLPRNQGNNTPPGELPYEKVDINDTSHTFSFDTNKFECSDGPFYIAAHGVVLSPEDLSPGE